MQKKVQQFKLGPPDYTQLNQEYCGALEVYSHTKNQNNPACLSQDIANLLF